MRRWGLTEAATICAVLAIQTLLVASQPQNSNAPSWDLPIAPNGYAPPKGSYINAPTPRVPYMQYRRLTPFKNSNPLYPGAPSGTREQPNTPPDLYDRTAKGIPIPTPKSDDMKQIARGKVSKIADYFSPTDLTDLAKQRASHKLASHKDRSLQTTIESQLHSARGEDAEDAEESAEQAEESEATAKREEGRKKLVDSIGAAAAEASEQQRGETSALGTIHGKRGRYGKRWRFF